METTPSVVARSDAVIHARNAFIVVEVMMPSRSAGGIILPTVQEKNRLAIVHSVGDGVLCLDGHREPISLRVGDTILLRPGRGTQFTANGKTYCVLDQAEIPVVFKATDGGQLADPDTVDPTVVRVSSAAAKPATMQPEASRDDGMPNTESHDGQPSDDADRMAAEADADPV